MIRVMFVCLGNICRSPMAEFVLKDMVKRHGMEDIFCIASSALSSEELGNPVYPGTRNKLRQLGISCDGKYAVLLKRNDYEKYDYFLGMESRHVFSMQKLFGGDPQKKVMRLLDFSSNPRDIDDPWYTRDFDRTYLEIREGCECFLKEICALKRI